MFRVTPVNENRERKVSFSPDIDESYRHQVVDKIKGLMEEVQVIHTREEKHMKKVQEHEAFDFKQKQELELQAFLKKQKEEANSFDTGQSGRWNDLKERHTQETWRLFGRPGQGRGDRESRGSVAGLWANQDPRTVTSPSGGEGARSQQESPFSLKHPASPMGPHTNGWISTATPATTWNVLQSTNSGTGAKSWGSHGNESNTSWNGSSVSNDDISRTTSPNNYWNPNS